jgi:hypothetical protein
LNRAGAEAVEALLVTALCLRRLPSLLKAAMRKTEPAPAGKSSVRNKQKGKTE